MLERCVARTLHLVLAKRLECMYPSIIYDAGSADIVRAIGQNPVDG